MPITPFLQSRAFEPEVTKAMGVAFEKVCQTLGFSLAPGPASESVAKTVIALAERGEHDPERLYVLVLTRFRDKT